MKNSFAHAARIRNKAGLSGYVAEIGSGLVCSELGLPNELHNSHASYVGHWLDVLRGEKTAIIHAASKAEQAFTYLRSFSAKAPSSAAPQGDEAAEAEPDALAAAA